MARPAFVFLLGALVSAFCALAHAQPAATTSPVASERAPRLRERDTSELTLQSHEGLSYHILVSVPRGPAPAGGFPVFYILDGDGWFSTAVESARIREWGRLTPSIVVGVGYPSHAFFDERRSYDFTPSGSADPDLEANEQGGADRFLNFLTDTVKPWVRARYAIDENRQVLFGHSLGGLFVLHTLFTAPQSFNVYLAASPAIQFSNQIVLHEAPAFRRNAVRSQPRVLVTVGGLESQPSPAQVDDYRRYFSANPAATGGLSVEEALRQTFPPQGAFNKSRALRTLVGNLAHSGVDATFIEFPGQEHTPAGMDALNRGVAFALRPRPSSR